VEIGTAEQCREYVASLLDRDSAYDDDPAGDPPLLASDYRRALYAILALRPDGVLTAPGSVVAVADMSAFEAGQRSFADAVAVELAHAWSEDKVADRRAKRTGKPVAVSADEADEGADGT
jgi:hypothetical protein